MEKLFTKQQLIEMVKDNYKWNTLVGITIFEYNKEISDIICTKGTGMNKYNKKTLCKTIKELQIARQLKLS